MWLLVFVGFLSFLLPLLDPAHLEFLMAPLDNTRELTEKTVLFFRLWAGYLFAAIREHFANSIRVLLYQHFLNPMYEILCLLRLSTLN